MPFEVQLRDWYVTLKRSVVAARIAFYGPILWASTSLAFKLFLLLCMLINEC